MFGEAEPDPELASISTTREAPNAGRKDHWAIGGDDFDNWEGTDWSEQGGSTAVAINYPRPLTSMMDSSADWAAYEVSFGSNHTGGAQFCSGDGSTRYISDDIAAEIFSALGTRKGKEAISTED